MWWGRVRACALFSVLLLLLFFLAFLFLFFFFPPFFPAHLNTFLRILLDRRSPPLQNERITDKIVRTCVFQRFKHIQVRDVVCASVDGWSAHSCGGWFNCRHYSSNPPTFCLNGSHLHTQLATALPAVLLLQHPCCSCVPPQRLATQVCSRLVAIDSTTKVHPSNRCL